MKKATILLLATLALSVACGGGQTTKNSTQQSSSSEEPKPHFAEQLDYRIVKEYPHSTNSYTQGLQYVDGIMWEGTGEYGHSEINSYALGGAPKSMTKLPKSEFGEGITVLGDKVYQLTWTNNKVHVYDLQGNHLKDMRYVGEGWGLTSDGESLYMSNGTTDIYKVNPETFKREGKITVTMRGEAVNFINELEWIDGKIWAKYFELDAMETSTKGLYLNNNPVAPESADAALTKNNYYFRVPQYV